MDVPCLSVKNNEDVHNAILDKDGQRRTKKHGIEDFFAGLVYKNPSNPRLSSRWITLVGLHESRIVATWLES
jgi:hypothetical protein